MKILVTGATGFIGSHVMNTGQRLGHEMFALRRNPGSMFRIHLERQPSWVDGDLDQVDVSLLGGFDAVIHLAAHSANVPYDSLENCLLHNVIKPLAFFRASAKAGIRRFVVAGSCFEYGRSGERYHSIPTDAPLEPTQSYPASKAAASVAFHALAAELGLGLSIHRLFQVYGEGEAPGRLWPTLRQKAATGEDLEMTSGEQVRYFTPVEIVASRLLSAAGESVPTGLASVFHMSGGEVMSVREFSVRCWEQFEGKGRLLFGVIPYRKNEVMRFVPELPEPRVL